MKKAFYLGIAALTAFAFSSCVKEITYEEPQNLVTITLQAEKAGEETRAAAVEVEGSSTISYVWTDTDVANLKLYSVTTETVTGQNGTTEKEILTLVDNPTITLSSDNKILSITATVAENTTLRAVVASELTGKEGDDNRKPKVINTQKPTATNFDPNADILVAEDVTVSEFVNAKLNFHRPVTVNKMTLKNLVEGETLEKVVITSDKYLTGYFNWESMSGQLNELTVKYEGGQTIGTSKEFPIYFVAIPNASQTLSVQIETSQGGKNYRYVKTFGPVNFTKGKFSRFSVNLSDLREEVVDVDYSGEWVIAGTHQDFNIAATAWTSGYVYPASVVTIDEVNKVVTVKGETAPYKMTFDRVTSGDYAGMYTIVDANGHYLSATGGTSNNNLMGKDSPDETSYWSIAANQDGTLDILADKLADDARKSMRVNYNNGNPRVTCYATNSGQPKVVLYPFSKIAVDQTPVETFEFRKVSVVTSGKQYLIVASSSNKLYAAKPVLSGNYGYPAVVEVTAENDVITLSEMTNAFTITQETGGYTIKQSDDRLWYQSGTYDNFNLSTSPSSGQLFTIVLNNSGTFKVTNIDKNKYLQFNASKDSYGCYSTETGVMPYLYELQDGSVKEPVSAPTNVEAVVVDDAIMVSWEDVPSGVAKYVVTCTGQNNIEINAGVEEATFENLSDGVYSITVQAIAADHDVNEDSELVEINDLLVGALSEGETWSYTFESKIWNAQGDQTINGKKWTVAGTNTGTGSEYFAYNTSNNTHQFGSVNNPFNPLSFTSNFGVTYGVREIRVTTFGHSSIVATLSASVGGVAFKCNNATSVSLTSNSATYSFVSPDGNLKAGDIVISYSASVAAPIYLKKITINPAPATQLIMSDVACTTQTSSSLTFGWSAVSNAVGYQVSTNGTDFDSMQQGLTYTLSGLDPEHSYTIWVRAVGDGFEYLTSSPKSASGTTAAAGSVKTYSYTITTSDFTAAGYGKEMTDITATATDGSGATVTVSHATKDAGLQSGKIQFKKNAGMLYNTTDLGTVTSVTLTGASGGTGTVYKGSTQNPTTSGSGGFFTIKETANGTLTCTSITVTFEK